MPTPKPPNAAVWIALIFAVTLVTLAIIGSMTGRH